MLLHGPRGPSLYPDDHGSLGEAGTGPRHASAYGCSRKNFLSFALALFALGIWCIITVSLFLAVTVPVVWVLLMSTRIGFFGR